MNPEISSTNSEISAKTSSGKSELIFAWLAFAAIAIIAILAFLPTETTATDRLVLLPLGLAALAFWIPAILRRIEPHQDIAAFLLCAAMFVIYGFARAAGPTEGFALHFAILPEDEFVVPYSAFVVVFGALICCPLWWQLRNRWAVSIIAGIAIIAMFALISFTILKTRFAVGPTEILDPSALPDLAMNLVEYGCLALLCSAVAARRETRILALRVLPGVLLMLWARHQFFAASGEAESE